MRITGNHTGARDGDAAVRVFLDARLSVRGLGIATATRRLTEQLARDRTLQIHVNASSNGWNLRGKTDTLIRSGLLDLNPRFDGRTFGNDVVHYFGNTSPRWPDFRCIVTVHDLMSLRHSGRKAALFRRLLIDGLRRGQTPTVVAISQQTADDLLQEIPDLDPRRLFVVPHGRRPGLERSGARSHILLLGGAADPRKRFGLGVAGYARYAELAKQSALPLVVAGRAGISRSDLAQLPDHLVKLVADPDEGEMEDIIASSACLIYPTREEGFGLPIVEAGEFGTPVVLDAEARIPFEPQGHHVFQVAGASVNLWAEQIRSAVNHGPVPRPMEHLPTWYEVGQMYAELYRDVLQ